MLQIIAVAVAAALFAGCSRREENPPHVEPEPRVQPNPLPATPAQASTLNRVNESLSNFTGANCNPNSGSRPAEYSLSDPRGDFCRLHTILTGRVCELNGQGQIATIDEGGPLPNSLVANFTFSNLNRLLADPNFRNKFSGLQGLSMYLYSGRACGLDGEADMVDMIEAYTLYAAARREFRSEFDRGAIGCVLSVATLNGTHHHQEGARLVAHHASHPQIVTEATRQANSHAFPAGVQTSGCGPIN